MKSATVCVVTLTLLLATGTAWGATITVTTTEPGRSNDGLCSLVEAIDNANDGGVHSDCESGENGADTIEMANAKTYKQPQWSWFVIKDEVTLEGNQSTLEPEGQSWASGIWCNASCTIHDLEIRNYRYTAAVVGLSENHHLVLDRCSIAQNTVGIYSQGPITVTATRFISNGVGVSATSPTEFWYSEFSGNSVGLRVRSFSDSVLDNCFVSDNARGIVHSGSGSLVIRDSTITGNGRKGPVRVGAHCAINFGCGNDGDDVAQLHVAGSSIFDNDIVGGICVFGATDTTLERSTLKNNLPSIHVYCPNETPGKTTLNIRDSTIVDFAAIEVEAEDADSTTRHAQIRIKNTIIAAPATWPGPTDPPPRCNVREHRGSIIDADFISQGFNLVDNDSCGLNHHTDMIVGDVMLSGLDDRGGPTWTHMPLEGSPAIDMGDEDCLHLDQRGFLRPADGDGDGVAHCDCGAVEYGAVPPQESHDPNTRASALE